MVNIITISIDRYNTLYKRALQADALEKENAELRERLDSTYDVSYEVIDGPELRNDTNKVTLDATEVYQVIREALDKVKEEEKELELDGDKYAKHLTKWGSVTKEGSVEFERNAKSDNGMIAKPIHSILEILNDRAERKLKQSMETESFIEEQNRKEKEKHATKKFLKTK